MEDKLEALHRHASKLESLRTMEDIAELTREALRSSLGFDLASIGIVDGDAMRFPVVVGGEEYGEFKLPLDGPGITVKAVNTKKTQMVPDTSMEEDYVKGPEQEAITIRSELDVPVIVDHRAVAVITVQSEEAGFFTEQDKRVIEILAEHVASAIRRLREQAEQQRYEERLEALHAHATELGRAETIEEIGETTFNAIEQVLGFNSGGFLVVEGDLLREILSRGIEIDEVFEMPLDGPGVTVRVVRTGETQLIHDIRMDEDFILGPAEGLYEPLSELAVPIIVDEKAVGVINLENEKLAAFTEEDGRLLEIFSEHVASAMSRLMNIEKLRASEERWRTLLEASMDAVTVNVGTELVYVNRRLADLLGYSSSSELIGRDITELDAPEYREMIRARTLRRQRGEEVPRRYELKLLRRDGTRIDVETQTTLIEYEGKPAALSFVRDITERKQAEQKLQEYADHLEEMVEEKTRELLNVERMATAGRVASMVGHDLRGPLQTISNATYLLRKSPEKTEDSLKMIEGAVHRATQMLEEFRNRTRGTPPNIVTVDLGSFIRVAVEEAQIPSSIDVALRLGEGLKAVSLDPLKMRRVLDNLIGNAVDAMPQGGTLTLSARAKDETVVIEVSDTGVGIPEEEMGNLFKPFYTTKSKGMGLGLAYIKRAVEAHGGTVNAESKVGEGTIFTIIIPFTPQR